MNREELEKKLKMTGVPEYIYNLTDHGKKDERWCFERDQEKWSVYYSESGIRTTNQYFASEDAACQFLYEQLHGIGRII